MRRWDGSTAGSRTPTRICCIISTKSTHVCFRCSKPRRWISRKSDEASPASIRFAMSSTQRIDGIRTDMMAQVRADAAVTMHDQRQNIGISALLTALAAILGLTFSMFVSSGITRPVRRLLDGTRAVEAGRLDGSIDVTTQDEIGQLTTAFNAMVAQLRPQREDAGDLRPLYRPARRGNAGRPAGIGRDRRPTAGDDGAVLRHEGIYQPERGHDAAGPGQGDESLPVGDVGGGPKQSRRDRQIHRRWP